MSLKFAIAATSLMNENFKSGLRNKSPLVLCVALFLLLSILLSLQVFFDCGVWTEIPMKYWLKNKHDSAIFVSWTVNHLKRYPPKEPLVVIVGGSNVQQAVSKNDELSSAISKALGRQVLSYVLFTARQTFAEDIAIIDNLPNIATTVIIGVSIYRFSWGQEGYKMQRDGRGLLLESATLQSYGSRTDNKKYLPFGILPGILSHMKNYMIEIYRQVKIGEPPFLFPDFQLNAENSRPISTISEKRRMIQSELDNRIPAFHKYFTFNALMLERAVRRCKERGLNIVILELPNNSEIIGEAFNAQVLQYRAFCNEIAAAYDISYLDFNDQLTLTNADFHDLVHIANKKARVTWENKLAENLVSLYRSGIIGRRK